MSSRSIPPRRPRRSAGGASWAPGWRAPRRNCRKPLRVVLALRHDEGLSFEEIARLTGAPASTVKSRFAAALARLRVRLEQLGYGPEEITP